MVLKVMSPAKDENYRIGTDFRIDQLEPSAKLHLIGLLTSGWPALCLFAGIKEQREVRNLAPAHQNSSSLMDYLGFTADFCCNRTTALPQSNPGPHLVAFYLSLYVHVDLCLQPPKAAIVTTANWRAFISSIAPTLSGNAFPITRPL
jgi:hypothetical protein